MTRITIEHVSATGFRRIRFGLDPDQQRIDFEGEVSGLPDYALYSYDAERDVAYRTPELLTPAQLPMEIDIHFPASLLEHIGQTPIASCVGHQVLMQPVLSVVPRISPLAALKALLARVGDVNTAMLYAENGSLMLVRRAGVEWEAHLAHVTLETFLHLHKQEREAHFPDFDALEIIIAGGDAQVVDLPSRAEFPLESIRKIAWSDMKSVCSADQSVAHELIDRVPMFALELGAALFLLDVEMETA